MCTAGAKAEQRAEDTNEGLFAVAAFGRAKNLALGYLKGDAMRQPLMARLLLLGDSSIPKRRHAHQPCATGDTLPTLH